MENLEYMRGLRGYSVDNLAEMTQATVADVKAWEAGDKEPSLTTKRDLAMIFGVDINFLDGSMGASTDCTMPFLHLAPRDDSDDEDVDYDDHVSGYWGQVGIKLRGKKSTKWYPISTQAVNKIQHALMSRTKDLGLVGFQTLNNRLVIFRMPAVERVVLLDEACDQVEGDWNVAFDSVEGKPLEVYRALTRRMNDEKTEDESEAYKALIDEAIEGFGLKYEHEYHNLLATTYVHLEMNKGEITTQPYDASDQIIFDIYERIDCGDGDSFDGYMLLINDEATGLEAFHNWSDVALIDSPLLPYLALKKADDEHYHAHYGYDDELDDDDGF